MAFRTCADHFARRQGSERKLHFNHDAFGVPVSLIFRAEGLKRSQRIGAGAGRRGGQRLSAVRRRKDSRCSVEVHRGNKAHERFSVRSKSG